MMFLQNSYGDAHVQHTLAEAGHSCFFFFTGHIPWASQIQKAQFLLRPRQLFSPPVPGSSAKKLCPWTPTASSWSVRMAFGMPLGRGFDASKGPMVDRPVMNPAWDRTTPQIFI